MNDKPEKKAPEMTNEEIARRAFPPELVEKLKREANEPKGTAEKKPR